MTKVTNITGIFLVIHIWFWALHYQDYWNSLTFFFVIAQIWHISILMISYPHYLNYSFLSFLELKKYHLSYQITQITKIVNLFQEQNDKIVTIVTNIIHRFFSFWKKLAHIEPCLLHWQSVTPFSPNHQELQAPIGNDDIKQNHLSALMLTKYSQKRVSREPSTRPA